MVPACWLCGCRGWVPQEGGQWPLSRRKLCPSSCLDARHFRSSLYVSGAFQATPQCWSSEGMSLCKSMCGFFKRNWLELQKFFHWLNSYCFLHPSTRTLVLGSWCEAGTPHFWDSPSEFLSSTYGCGTSLLHVSAPHNSLGGCVFINSAVVWVSFNLISDGSACWFYTLVVILKWLCKELICVYLYHHLDLKFLTPYSWFQTI